MVFAPRINLPEYWGCAYLPLAFVFRDMSQTQQAQGTVRGAHHDGTTGAPAVDPEAILEILTDDDCRAILAATSEEARSATELSECCDLPLSTAYRKLDRLTEAGVLAERTRVRLSGKHASEYRRAVEGVGVTISEAGEMQMTVTRGEDGAPAAVQL